MLRAVAGLCHGTFRQGADVAARIGGEEFAILMPATSHEEAMQVAERLRQSIADLRVDIGDGVTLSCTVSIGVATVSPEKLPTTDFDSLLVRADRALYRAKDGGRNRVMGTPSID